jgi:MYXO-CTERM domain-containing protein
MRKSIAVFGVATALTFGGTGIANATVDQAPMPSSTTTTLADHDNNTDNNQHSDKTGLWGLTGLLGLAGLAGLRRRNTNANAAVDPTTGRRPAV